MYSLPHARILANTLLEKCLSRFWCFETPHTSRLWKHKCRPVQFTLVIDDFGVKYVGQEHAEHLCDALRASGYKIETDRKGELYCRIKIDWNYANTYLYISMPGYIQMLLQKYTYMSPKRPKHYQHSPQSRQYNKNSQTSTPGEKSPAERQTNKNYPTGDWQPPILC